MIDGWSKSNWRNYPILHQVEWPDESKAKLILEQLATLPAFVYADETRSLELMISKAAKGEAFILHAGDCAESFSRCNGSIIHNLIKVILQMAIIITFAGEKKVIKIGRIAGQYAKPRSMEYEEVNGRKIPVYRGDMINSPEAAYEMRIPDPDRMLEAYYKSSATLNLIRAFTAGGYASFRQIRDWNKNFKINEHLLRRYSQIVNSVDKAVRFFNILGIDIESYNLHDAFYVSHEALILNYEEAFTRIDTTTDMWYNTSSHFLWIGDRTRQSDGAHIEYIRGINNPIGIKIGPTYDISDIMKILQKVNPENKHGKISLITRMGINQIEKKLPPLLREIKKEGFNVAWICDPMHGNTTKHDNYRKTRMFDDISLEIKQFFLIHKDEQTIPAGIHLELSGENVTECIGGLNNITIDDLDYNYQSSVDPRLNFEQSIELAFLIAEILAEKILTQE